MDAGGLLPEARSADHHPSGKCHGKDDLQANEWAEMHDTPCHLAAFPTLRPDSALDDVDPGERRGCLHRAGLHGLDLAPPREPRDRVIELLVERAQGRVEIAAREGRDQRLVGGRHRGGHGVALGRVLPQAIRATVPSLGNYVISMLKDTPFLIAITVADMVSNALEFGGNSFRYLEPITLAGVIFFLASYPASVLVRRLEKRLAYAS